MKTFLTSVFLFFALISNAQIQKGDLFFGTSVFNFNNVDNKDLNFSQGSIGFSPSFGLFVTDNMLVGGRISPFFNFSKFDTSRRSNPSISGGVFASQYFGSGNLRGLAGLSFDFSSFRSDGDFHFGGAYFFNNFSAIELTYNLELFNKLQDEGIDFFANGVRPVLGLTLKSFFLREREGVENLLAINSISRGTWRANLAGSYSNLKRSKGMFLALGVTYFLQDNLFLRSSSQMSRSKIFLQDEELKFATSSTEFEIGYYMRLKENFFGKFSGGLSLRNTNNNFQGTFFGGTPGEIVQLKSTRNTAFVNLGLAIFMGRHKIEPSLGISFFKDNFENFDFEAEENTNFSINILYEYFLSANLSITSSLNLQPNNSFANIEAQGFEPNLAVRERTISSTTFNVGFGWYF